MCKIALKESDLKKRPKDELIAQLLGKSAPVAPKPKRPTRAPPAVPRSLTEDAKAMNLETEYQKL